MACRPKLADDDDAPSSKIFKSLGESEAGRSFRNVNLAQTGSGRASFNKGPSSAASGGGASFKGRSREGEGDHDVRSVRANGAMRLRESLAEQKKGKLPRAQTFERKKAPECAYDDDEEDDDEENVSPKGENKSLSERSSIVAQINVRHAPSVDTDGAPRSTDGLQKSLNARFKSKSGVSKGGARDDETCSDEDDDVIASA